MGTQPKNLNSLQFDWLVTNRSAIQEQLLALWQFYVSKHEAMVSHPKHYDAFQWLVGIAFSLWRAVFLADTERTPKEVVDHTGSFLSYLLGDNAIAYTQDRNTVAWSCGYYLNNVHFRLNAMRRALETRKMRSPLAPAETALESILTKLPNHDAPTFDDTATRRSWSDAFHALRDAIGLLDQLVAVADCRESPPKA